MKNNHKINVVETRASFLKTMATMKSSDIEKFEDKLKDKPALQMVVQNYRIINGLVEKENSLSEDLESLSEDLEQLVKQNPPQAKDLRTTIYTYKPHNIKNGKTLDNIDRKLGKLNYSTKGAGKILVNLNDSQLNELNKELIAFNKSQESLKVPHNNKLIEEKRPNKIAEKAEVVNTKPKETPTAEMKVAKKATAHVEGKAIPASKVTRIAGVSTAHDHTTLKVNASAVKQNEPPYQKDHKEDFKTAKQNAKKATKLFEEERSEALANKLQTEEISKAIAKGHQEHEDGKLARKLADQEVASHKQNKYDAEHAKALHKRFKQEAKDEALAIKLQAAEDKHDTKSNKKIGHDLGKFAPKQLGAALYKEDTNKWGSKDEKLAAKSVLIDSDKIHAKSKAHLNEQKFYQDLTKNISGKQQNYNLLELFYEALSLALNVASTAISLLTNNTSKINNLSDHAEHKNLHTKELHKRSTEKGFKQR